MNHRSARGRMVVNLALAALWCGACSRDEAAAPAVSAPEVVPTPAPEVVTEPPPPPPQQDPAPPAPVDPAAARKAKMYAEVVLRLRGTDLTADPDTRSMVDKALLANRGTATFVEI
ncbi:MAG: hypothetical protein KDC48_18340, partial [Planctomycetes bacterium]|nr:hypothetical protein [Planctomycetota bacterium]